MKLVDLNKIKLLVEDEVQKLEEQLDLKRTELKMIKENIKNQAK